MDDEGLAVLRARGDLELEMLVGQDALDVNRAAEGGLGDANVNLAEQVVPVALEALVGLDLDGHDEVAGTSAAEARLAVAAQTQLAAGAHARRNLDVQALMGADATVAVAVRAGLVDDGALALAIRARGAGLHGAEDGLLDRGHVARAVAVRAGLLLAAGLAAGAVAVLARAEAVERNGSLAALSRLLKGDGERDGQIPRPARRRARSRARSRVPPPEPPKIEEKDVIDAHATENVGEIDKTGSAGHAVDGAVAVVHGALLLVGQDRVGLGSARRTARSHRAHRYGRDEA